MPKYAVPVTTTQVFVLNTTADYDAVLAWLSAPSTDVKREHGVDTVVGSRSQRRITITAPVATTDINTDIPILPLPKE